jgi:SAM-dependent methyltransferase
VLTEFTSVCGSRYLDRSQGAERQRKFTDCGCTTARGVIPATKYLSSAGKYTGLDIIRDSIAWCSQNITPVYPNFQFIYEDVHSQIHNPGGEKQAKDVRFPVAKGSVDKVFLSSLFTHMFPDDVPHYLREIHRVLKPTGVALSTMFLLNDRTLDSIRRRRQNSRFFTNTRLTRNVACRIFNILKEPWLTLSELTFACLPRQA